MSQPPKLTKNASRSLPRRRRAAMTLATCSVAVRVRVRVRVRVSVSVSVSVTLPPEQGARRSLRCLRQLLLTGPDCGYLLGMSENGAGGAIDSYLNSQQVEPRP